METANASRLHPALLVAALSVTAFSLTGIGVLTGLISWQGAAPVAAVVSPPPAVPPDTAGTPASVVEPPQAVKPPAEPVKPPAAPVKSPAEPVKSPAEPVKPVIKKQKPAVVRTVVQKAPTSAAVTTGNPPRRSEPVPEHVAAPAQPLPPLPSPASSPPVASEVWPAVPPQAASAVAQPLPPPPAVCHECGWIESVHTVEQPGEASGLGAVAGGVLGGAVGSQVGKGRGNQLATIAGVVGGAYAGHQIEKSQRKRVSYEITVRMEDGSAALLRSDTPPAHAIGQRVRVVNGQLMSER